MKRREFITLLSGAAAWPLAARAQQAGKMRRIGVLMSVAADDPEAPARVGAFSQGLAELGWTIGRNVRVDYRWFALDADAARKYAAELVALAPDVALASSTVGVTALQQATRSVPIVFTIVADPVGAGLVDSLARPGGNATGFTPVDFATGMITAVLSATTFIVILWMIGGTLTIQFSGMAVTIPGFLVVAAVIYAVAASGSMVLIGRRFIAVSENKNQAEAEYRYVLTRLRENGESIALLQGEDEERNGVDRSLKMVLRAWRDICIQTMRTTIVSQTSSYIAPVLPIILCLSASQHFRPL